MPKATGYETKSLLENNRLKVMEVRFKPGARVPIGTYPARFIYALTDGALVFAPAGKTPYELSFRVGEALWLPSEVTATQNETGKEVRVLVVEVRDGGASVRSSSGSRGHRKGRGRGRGKRTR